MTEPPPLPEQIDLSETDDPRDAVHRAVACLAQGGVVGLSTESDYGMAASALQPESVARLPQIQPLDHSGPLTLLLKGPEELADWVSNLSELGRRLARRVWPGPVTLMFRGPMGPGLAQRLPAAVRSLVFVDETVALRIPGQAFVREVLRLMPGPLVLADVVGPGREVATTAESLRPLHGLSMIVDDGPTPLGQAATIVHVNAEDWSIVRPGVVDAPTLTRLAGTILLFVCTGNTCRSPMAAALCKMLLAHRLGCRIDELAERGHVVQSAGLAATPGMPAAAHAVEVVRDRGGSLQDHASRPVTGDLIRHADLIVAMTNDHLDALLDHSPEATLRARLLDPSGGDVNDPIGADRATYTQTARAIEAHLERLLDELGV